MSFLKYYLAYTGLHNHEHGTATSLMKTFY